MKQLRRFTLTVFTFFAGKLAQEVSSSQLMSEQLINFQSIQNNDNGNFLSEEFDYHLFQAKPSMDLIQQQQNKRELQIASGRTLASKNVTINLNNYSLLASPLSDQELQTINTRVFYINQQGYTVYSSSRSVISPDITATLNQTLLCPKGGDNNCYILLMANTTLPAYPKSKVKCLTTNLCFLTEPQNSSNQIVGILGYPFLVQKIPIDQAWTSNSTIFWSNSSPYLLLDQIPDPSYAVNVQNLFEPRLCIYNTQCFWQLQLNQLNSEQDPNSNLIQLGALNFTAYNDDRVFDVLNLGGQNVYVVTLKLSEAWYSQDFVIWQGLYPYKLIDVLNETSFFTLQPDLSTLGACMNQTNCFDNIVKVDVQNPFAQNDSVTCLGTTCFSAESTTKSEEVILIDDLSFLVSKVNFIDGWTQNQTIFWNGPIPYRLIIPILNEQFYTITQDPIGQRLCFENSWSNCLTNLRHLKSTEVTDQSTCLAPQQTGCYAGDTDSNFYQVMALQNATFIATQIGISSAWYLNQTVIFKSILDSWQMLYPLLDNDFSTDQLDISDPTLRVCTGGYNTNCFTELSILESSQQQSNQNTLLSDSEDGSEETEEQTEGEQGFCIGQFCFQGTLDTNQYDIISVNSETVLVIQSSVALSWNSTDSVVWLERINPYIPVLLLQNNSFSTIQVMLDEIRVCYGQYECYINITEVQVEDPQAENDTVQCYDEICYSGKIDQKNWEIALIDGDVFLVEQLTFSEAWQSQQQIIWNNKAESFVVYDLIDDRTFWTISLDILEILICSDGMNNCLSNFVFVDENTPIDQLTDQRCFGGFCYIGEIYYTGDCQIICLKDLNKNYCYFAIKLDNSTAKDKFQMEVIWINQTAYNVVIPVEANIPGSIISNIDSIIDCLPGDGCYSNLKQTKLNESTDTIKVICKQEFGKCWQGIPYDLEIELNIDGDGTDPNVGKEFIIGFQNTNLIGLFKQILFQDGWISTNIVFWVDTIPYEYEQWLDSSKTIDQNFKLSQFRMCLSINNCFVNIQLLNETSEYNNTELCIQDACFDGDLDESEREVALLGDITVLVIKLDYETAYTSMNPIIWQFKNGYDVQFVIKYNQFHTIVLALNSVFGCFGGDVQNCYNNFVPALKGQSVKSYQQINCFNQIDQCYKMDSFNFPYKTPEQYASIYKGEPRQVRLCFDSYCMDAKQTTFDDAWNEETNDAYIWIGQQPYIPLQLSNDDSQYEETIYGELDNTVICPEGIKPAKSRFDQYCSKPLYFYESSTVQEFEEKINCVREGSEICFSYIPFIVSEKVIYFTDQELKVLVQDINFTEAWYSNETILWYNGLDPYKLIDSVDIQTNQNLNFKLLDIEICYDMNDCWINFQNFNDQYTYSIEKPYKCLIDYCFVAQFDDTSYSIALINNKTFFFQQLSFENAWYSEAEIIWYDQTGYKMLKQADSNGFYDLIINYKELIYCLRGGKICVNKLRPVNPREQSKHKIQTIKLGSDFYNSDIYSKLKIKPPTKRKDVLCYEKIQEIKQKNSEQQQEEQPELEVELKNYQSLKSKQIGRHDAKKAYKKNVKKNSSNGLKVEINLKKNNKRNLKSLIDIKFEQNNVQINLVDQNNTSNEVVATKIRQDFRDYFYYAIGPQINDCSSPCPKSQCCTQVTSQNHEIRNQDYLCMNRQIVNNLSSITINDNYYLLECMKTVREQADYF